MQKGETFNIVNNILKSLFERQQASLLTRIADITALNNNHYTSVTDGFKYKNIDYFSLPELSRKLWVRLNPLHETLYGEVDRYLLEKSEVQISNKRVELFIASAIQQAPTLADIRVLLPDSLHQDLPDYIRNTKGNPTVSEKFIEDFNYKYRDYITVVNTRIITKMLTG